MHRRSLTALYNGNGLEKFELCFRRFVVPFGCRGPMSYKELDKEVLDRHFALRTALWKETKNPLAILLGRELVEWYKNNVVPLAVIPYSQGTIFGQKGCLRVEADDRGNVTRHIVACWHPAAEFYGRDVARGRINNYSRNSVLACTSIK